VPTPVNVVSVFHVAMTSCINFIYLLRCFCIDFTTLLVLKCGDDGIIFWWKSYIVLPLFVLILLLI